MSSENNEIKVTFWPTQNCNTPDTASHENAENAQNVESIHSEPLTADECAETKNDTVENSSGTPNPSQSGSDNSIPTTAAPIEAAPKEEKTENSQDDAHLNGNDSASKLVENADPKKDIDDVSAPELEQSPQCDVPSELHTPAPQIETPPKRDIPSESQPDNAKTENVSPITPLPYNYAGLPETLPLLPIVTPQEIVPSRPPIQSSFEFGDDTPAPPDAPDLSHEPVIPKSEFERTLIFDKAVNRWDDANAYVLPQVGSTISHYKILSELGRGGFGAVYKAKNLTLGREEALKLILPSAKTECSDIEKRFEREIDIVSRLEHPNIVRLYSSGALEHGIVWMSMELVRGDRLDVRLSNHGAMKFKKAKNIIAQLLCGLQEAHRHQIVHRDLKPANIMLSKKEGYADQVIILDFGLSKALGTSEDSSLQNLTQINSKHVYGTPQYMAPEQLNKGRLGPWTDVYSAGLIFYELLTGKTAITGTTIFDIAHKQNYAPIELPETFQDTAVEAVILKACAKNPAKRYKNAGEFFDALQHIEDETDPISVLSNEKRAGRNLASMDMLPQTRDEISQMKTQTGLPIVEPLIQHTERTAVHHHFSYGACCALIILGFITVLLICFVAAYALGVIDFTIKL